MNTSHWRCNGESVQGATHQRLNLVNQDAIHCEMLTGDQQTVLLMVVSDGHGGSSYFRSHIGADYAVQATAQLVKQVFLAGDLNADFLTTLPQQIVQQWRTRVLQHHEQHPFTLTDWQKLQPQADWQYGGSRSQLEQDPTIAYGATLLLVIATDDFVFYFQIGDGDILCVQSDGTVYHPLPIDPRLVGNGTLSLCLPEVWKEGRSQIYLVQDMPHPALILAATDGYANSYASDEDFCKIGTDYLKAIRKDGFDPLLTTLPKILAEISRRGSGDDVTLGIAYLNDRLESAIVPSKLLLASHPMPEVASTSCTQSRSEFWVMSLSVLLTGGFFFVIAQMTPRSLAPAASPVPQISPDLKQSPQPKRSTPSQKRTPQPNYDDYQSSF